MNLAEKRPTPKLAQLLAFTVTAAVPLVSLPGLTSPFSTPKIGLLAVWVVAGGVWLISRGLAELRFESMLQKLALAWLVLVSASALWGETASLKALLIALLPPASFLLVTWLKPSPGSLATALAASGLAIGAIAIAQYLGLDPFRLFGWQGAPAGTVRMRVYTTLGNPNFTAAFLASVLPLTWMLDGSRLKNRVLSGLAVLLILLGILVTGSRAPIAGGAVFVLFGLWLFPSVPVRSRILGLISVILFAAFLAFLSAGRPISETFKGRLFVWRVAVEHISVRTLILGDGPGSFAISYPEWETEWVASAPRDGWSLRFLGYQEHAHNDWLEILVEQGIGGLVLLLLIPLSALRIFMGRRSEFTGTGAGAVAGIAIFLGLACVDFPLHRPAESFAFWTLVAIVQLSFSTVSRAAYSRPEVPVEAVAIRRGGVL